ncbi:hypothetical protein [Corynebacterium aquatimens]|uniref:PPE family protein n=1 Tax=Corynebacterium aquatimens TaxID=1190508 RepID=A0A931E2G6_9CORY|nr:hypothetical protein [Corynebacterium aquatimens]MBG6122021.1 hypothetical protein [Corynebacterium aquatimens]
MSGLDQSGGMHGLISSVSQPEATKALADHFGDVVELLSSQLVSVELLDTSIGDNLAALGLMGSAAQNAWDSTVAPVMTASVVNPTTNHFNASPAVAGRPVSLDIVTGQLASSDVGSMSAIAANWTDTAGAVTEAVGQIPAAVGALASSAETPFVAKAIATLNQIGAAGGQYAANAGALAAHTTNLVTVTEANTLQAAVLLSVVRAQGNPAAAKAMEEAFLSAFGGKLTSELVPTVPGFRQLLPPLGAHSGGALSTAAGAAPVVAGFGATPLPTVVQDALNHAGYRDLAAATSPVDVIEQYGRPNPDMLASIAEGATPTQIASAGAPSLPPVTTGMPGAGGGVPGGLGAGGLGTGGGPGFGVGSGGVGMSPGGVGVSPAGAGAGAGAGGFAPLGGLGGFGGSGGAGAGGSGRPGGVGGLGGGTGAGPGFGRGGFGAGGLGAGGYGAGGVGAGGAGAGSSTVVGAGGNNGGRAGAGRSGVASAGGAGVAGARRGDRKNGADGAVKAVTSAVERDGNLRALLGEGKAVVPGVIGAWVREPQR